MAELRIGTLVDLDQMSKVLEDFSEATGFATVTVDTRGLPVTSPCGFTDFCKKMREDPERSKLCHGCDAHGGLQSLINGEPHVYRCHAGLVDFSIPVTAGDTYVGAILCGQVRVPETEQPDFLAPDSSWSTHPELDVLHKQIPIVSRRRVKAAAETLLGLQYEVEGTAARSLLPLPSQQHSTATALSLPVPRKLLPVAAVAAAPVPTEASPPSPAAPELSSVIPLRPLPDTKISDALSHEDLANAVALVTVKLDEAYGAGPNRRELIINLEDHFVHVATECAPRVTPHVSQAIQRQRNRRAAYDSRYQSQLHMERLLVMILDEIERSRPQRRRDIRDLLNSIARTPQRTLSLSAAARMMHMSPGHLSKLFKSVTGCTFVSYVTSRRISRARLMLTSTQMPVQRIATELGFNQVNYFSRVFRAYTGVSPSEFRRQGSSPHGKPADAHLSTHDQALLRA